MNVEDGMYEISSWWVQF